MTYGRRLKMHVRPLRPMVGGNSGLRTFRSNDPHPGARSALFQFSTPGGKRDN